MSTHLSMEQSGESSRPPDVVELPAPTAWPLVLALGVTLLFAGLLTNASLSVLGLILTLAGCVGWFRQVLPREQEVAVPVVAEELRITTERKLVERVPVAPDLVRAWLPLQTYPISAGVKGGWAGSVAMAVLACTYGLLKAGSIWYPINLLAATVCPRQSLQARFLTTEFISPRQLRNRCLLHGIGSTLVGLALRRHATNVSAAAHRAGRTDCAGTLVGLLYSISGPSQSTAREPHRLGLVHGFPSGVWRSRGSCRDAAGARLDARESAVCNARGRRGSWNYVGEARQG